MNVKSIVKKFTLAALASTALVTGGVSMAAEASPAPLQPSTFEEAVNACKDSFDPMSAAKKGALVGGGVGIIADKPLRGVVIGGGGAAAYAKYKQLQCIKQARAKFGVTEKPATTAKRIQKPAPAQQGPISY